MALEQGREVFAVPGRICDSLSYGCNSLIRQGAGIASCPEDIVEYLRRNIDKKLSEAKGVKSEGGNNMMAQMNEIQNYIYGELDFYPQTSAVIYEKTIRKGMQMTVSEVMNALVELCLLGVVSQNGAGFYKRG